ncbi:glycerol-3-phosphate O-acyltransferase 2 [Cyanidiococcus yangmingshanensis]|uniref:Glycerol-3-phosphate O-acyltransferase 2 n=1 Tax=Cyanidiococcus yangmingshanensis TaxID=2690220 RepID=A0A7J7IIM0_9RHOD|nr:glycerol-3-phosphate O-acyltransferase 2 [Cyanidiococcus yangmingshanensis]
MRGLVRSVVRRGAPSVWVRVVGLFHVRNVARASNLRHSKDMDVIREGKALDLRTINPRIVAAEYAVRGELPTRATRLQRVLEAGGPEAAALPFREVTYCNIGNPQALGNPPFTYHRRVMALCDCPDLAAAMPNAETERLFPADVREAAERILRSAGLGGTGAYSDSQGVSVIRQDVAAYMNARDGIADGSPLAARTEDVFLTNGSSGAILMLMALLSGVNDGSVALRGEGEGAHLGSMRPGILIPVPQYPIYSALSTALGIEALHYHLVEDQGWAIQVSELSEQVREARRRGIDARALVVISPGNPTGQLLRPENVRELVRFAHRERILLMADEVYADNVYLSGQKFESFRKVLHRDMPGNVQQELELVSLYSASKGLVGECGRRGGYMLLSPGIGREAREQLLKLASIMLCPNLGGQVMIDCVVRPPQPGQPSYDLYAKERKERYESLKRRASRIVDAFRSMRGVQCNPSEGAMYAFPRITVGENALEAAKRAGMPLDTFYCVSLLERTGICVVPGAGFGMSTGQRTPSDPPGVCHFYLRTTILPPDDKMEHVIDLLRIHHEEFLQKYPLPNPESVSERRS